VKKGKRKKADLPPRRRPRPRPVVFTDEALIRQRGKPPFQNDDGNYAEPDIVIAGGVVPDGVPEQIDCGKQIVIYSSRGAFVAACAGFGGPNDGNNALIQSARANARAVAKQIDCEKGCEKQILEIWRGWSCGPDGQRFFATAAVELLVRCVEPIEA